MIAAKHHCPRCNQDVVGYAGQCYPPRSAEPKADRFESVTLYPCGCTAKKEELDFPRFIKNTRPA